MRENPERLAWTILLVAFFVFCLLVVSIPIGIQQFTVRAFEKHPARVTAYGGAILMQTARSKTQTAIRPTEPDQEIQEGTILTTEPSSKAVVWLFDSNLQVGNNSQVEIVQARTPRFESSPQPIRIVVEIRVGKVIVGVAAATEERPRRFEVLTPHGKIFLEEGNYSITVTDTETTVSVRIDKAVGYATLQAAGESAHLGRGERGRMEVDLPPEGPLPGERNLVVNGDFSQPLSTGWIYDESHNKMEEKAGTAFVETGEDGRQIVHFLRSGDNVQHGENVIRQELDLDVRDANTLEVRLDAKLIYQSLSGGGQGGGQQSSEFPLMVRILYRDANGREHDWVRGFYYFDQGIWPVCDTDWCRGILIPQNTWHHFESANLMQSLALGGQKPTHLISLEVYASGHDYESLVTDIGIFVQE